MNCKCDQCIIKERRCKANKYLRKAAKQLVKAITITNGGGFELWDGTEKEKQLEEIAKPILVAMLPLVKEEWKSVFPVEYYV